MTSKIENILLEQEKTKYATETGIYQHMKMKSICTETNDGDSELQERIKKNPILERFFHKDARTEVPIAGYINGKFVSRRIDRMYVLENEKTVFILDYKTDVDKNLFYDKYIHQINEYKTLITDAFKGYKVKAFILWLNDFDLQQVN